MYHYIYWYIIYFHPVYWLYNKALEYDPMNLDKGVWLAIAVFGIAAWFGLARFLAETPGRNYGNMYVWWILIAAVHFWSIPIFFIYYVFASMNRRRWQGFVDRRYSDRSREEIYESAWQEKRALQKSTARRRK